MTIHGNWRSSVINQFGDCEVIDPHKNASEGHHVCALRKSGKLSNKENKARADLIAAAPSTLHALKNLLWALEEGVTWPPNVERESFLEAARDAIDKAEPRTEPRKDQASKLLANFQKQIFTTACNLNKIAGGKI